MTKTENSYIQINSDGRVILTDAWSGSLGLSESVSFLEPGLFETSQTQKFPIGIVDVGRLYGEEAEIAFPHGTGAIYFHGCALKCSHCYQPEFFASKAQRSTFATLLYTTKRYMKSSPSAL